MTAREEVLRDLRHLGLDRTAVRLMQEDIRRIQEDENRKELPAAQRAALVKERLRLESCLSVTLHSIHRMERLLDLLNPEERRILEVMLIHPRPEAVFDLTEELHCETTRVYRLRSVAISKLTRLRYGAGE